MLGHLPKKIKKEVFQLNELVHERRLAAALKELHQKFEAWQQGRLNSFDLADEIHKFHDGPNRDLYKAHVMAAQLADNYVAGALRCGLLKEEEVSEPTREALRNVYAAILNDFPIQKPPTSD